MVRIFLRLDSLLWRLIFMLFDIVVYLRSMVKSKYLLNASGKYGSFNNLFIGELRFLVYFLICGFKALFWADFSIIEILI